MTNSPVDREFADIIGMAKREELRALNNLVHCYRPSGDFIDSNSEVLRLRDRLMSAASRGDIVRMMFLQYLHIEDYI